MNCNNLLYAEILNKAWSTIKIFCHPRQVSLKYDKKFTTPTSTFMQQCTPSKNNHVWEIYCFTKI